MKRQLKSLFLGFWALALKCKKMQHRSKTHWMMRVLVHPAGLKGCPNPRKSGETWYSYDYSGIFVDLNFLVFFFPPNFEKGRSQVKYSRGWHFFTSKNPHWFAIALTWPPRIFCPTAGLVRDLPYMEPSIRHIFFLVGGMGGRVTDEIFG